MVNTEYCSKDKYIGLPSAVGKSKYLSFEAIPEKFWARVNNCKHKFLYQVGNEILSKAVIQTIPTYPMSVFFLLHMRICKEITSITARF